MRLAIAGDRSDNDGMNGYGGGYGYYGGQGDPGQWWRPEYGSALPFTRSMDIAGLAQASDADVSTQLQQQQAQIAALQAQLAQMAAQGGAGQPGAERPAPPPPHAVRAIRTRPAPPRPRGPVAVRPTGPAPQAPQAAPPPQGGGGGGGFHIDLGKTLGDVANVAKTVANVAPGLASSAKDIGSTLASLFGTSGDAPVAANPVWTSLSTVLSEAATYMRSSAPYAVQEQFHNAHLVDRLAVLAASLALDPNNPTLERQFHGLSGYLSGHAGSSQLAAFVLTHPMLAPILGPPGQAAAGRYDTGCDVCDGQVRTAGLLDLIKSIVPHQQTLAQAAAMVHAQASNPGWGLQPGYHAPTGSWGADYQNALLRLQGGSTGPGAAIATQYR